MSKGVDGQTFDGMSIRRIQRLISRLKDHSYHPQPVRRTYILKKNGKRRPLGISSSDQIALAIDGTISEVQSGKITLCLSHMDEIKRYISEIEATAMRLAASYSGAIEIIQSVPGISQF